MLITISFRLSVLLNVSAGKVTKKVRMWPILGAD